ncbi:hypothetical protein K435DRAFT_933857 [Dendrothele bispora CBS 962.96]|uniref:Uncharacterized protein n=1 Tax=Dendrothele bispora (strain CBS 962.96) TaxID=1314807 RepID=A0A4V4HC88_DENBC|nr:hypothetical protein K435DRAFT_933857 [Dendrothele bispora CBS 962.96]
MLISTSVKIPFEEFYPVMNVKSVVIPLTVALEGLTEPYTQTVGRGMCNYGKFVVAPLRTAKNVRVYST